MKQYMIIGLLVGGASTIHAQENGLLEQYRKQVIEYNQDIKAADHSAAMYMEMKKSAKADFFLNYLLTPISIIPAIRWN